MSLTQALNQLVPKDVRKIYFINNNLIDLTMQELFEQLKKTRGTKTIVVSKNGMGSLTTTKLIEFIESPAVEEVRKFVLKDPIPN